MCLIKKKKKTTPQSNFTHFNLMPYQPNEICLLHSIIAANQLLKYHQSICVHNSARIRSTVTPNTTKQSGKGN